MFVICPFVLRRVLDIVAFCPATQQAPPASDEGNCLCDNDDRRDGDDQRAYLQCLFCQGGERIGNLCHVLGVAIAVCAAPCPGRRVDRDLQGRTSQVIQVVADDGKRGKCACGPVGAYRLRVVKAGPLQKRLCVPQEAHEIRPATCQPVAADCLQNITIPDLGADPSQVPDIRYIETGIGVAHEPGLDCVQPVQPVDHCAVSIGYAARRKRAEHQADD